MDNFEMSESRTLSFLALLPCGIHMHPVLYRAKTSAVISVRQSSRNKWRSFLVRTKLSAIISAEVRSCCQLGPSPFGARRLDTSRSHRVTRSICRVVPSATERALLRLPLCRLRHALSTPTVPRLQGRSCLKHQLFKFHAAMSPLATAGFLCRFTVLRKWLPAAGSSAVPGRTCVGKGHTYYGARVSNATCLK